jgi:hypothetical protein
VSLRRGTFGRRATGRQVAAAARSAIAYLSRHAPSDGSFEGAHDLSSRAAATTALYELAGSRFDDGTLAAIATREWSHVRDVMTAASEAVHRTADVRLAVQALVARIAHSTSRLPGDVDLLRSWTAFLVTGPSDDPGGDGVLALCGAFRILRDRSLLEEAAARGVALLASVGGTGRDDLRGADHRLAVPLAALEAIAPDAERRAALRSLVEPLLVPVVDGRVAISSLPWVDATTTTEIACRVESLVATLGVELCAGDRARASLLARAVLAGLASCYDRQVVPGHPRGTDADARGGFSERAEDRSVAFGLAPRVLRASVGALSWLGPRMRAAPRRTRGAKKGGSPRRHATAPRVVRVPVSLGMEWHPGGQTLRCGREVFTHEGPTPTDASHDVAHLLIAAASRLPWRPQGESWLVRFAEYNAVFVEHLLVETFNCVAQGGIAPESVLPKVLKHARWFVEEHFAPFPVTAEEAYRHLCAGLDADALVRLSPYFFAVKSNERGSPGARARSYALSFGAGDCPPPAPGSGAAMREVLCRQLSRMLERGPTRVDLRQRGIES